MHGLRPRMSTVLFLLLLGGTLLPAQPIEIFIPRALEDAEQRTGLAFANPSADLAEVQLQFLDALGLPLAVTDLTLPAGFQQAASLQEFFDDSILGMPGWVRASSDNIQVVGFFLDFRAAQTVSQIDGAEGLVAGQLASALVFPEVLNGPDEYTEITLIGFQGGEVELRLVGENGALLESVQQQLPPFAEQGSQFIGRLGEIFSVAIPQKAYVVATGQGIGLFGFEEFGTPSSTAARNGIPADPQAIPLPSSLFGAQFADVPGLTSVLTLINPTTSPIHTVLTATPMDPELEALSTERTLNPGTMLRESASELFGLEGDFIGWVEVAAEAVGLVGDVTFGSPDGSLLSSVQLQDIPADDVVFSQVTQSDISLTGITFLNPFEQGVQVEIDVFDATGLGTGSGEFALGPHEHRPKQLSELIDGFADQAGGYIRVRSEQPIYAFELFEFLDAGIPTALSAVPPQRISGTLSGKILLPEGIMAEEAGTVFVAALDPATQKTQRSGLADADANLEYQLTAFSGLYQLAAGTDPDGNGIICEAGPDELCGFFESGMQTGTVSLAAGQNASSIDIQLHAVLPAQLLGIRVLPGISRKDAKTQSAQR